jgi:hypothetical protein
MKFNPARIAAALSLAIAAGNAQAVLTSANTLSIQGDAVSAMSTTTIDSWYVASDGPMLDSFFTMGGSKEKQALGIQFAYLYNGANLTLTGAPQADVAVWTYYDDAGSNNTAGTGIGILSAIGDTATVDMSGWKVNWSTIKNIPLGGMAWSAGYTSGVGNITCTAGSGCAVGSAYTLTYTATVPYGDPSGFGGVKYYLELHGEVGAVPEASSYAMMLAGLGLIGVVARRRRAFPAV